ncbi:hypothetical protein L1D05_23545 [Vibrio vulnificus]|nr:hypothetical protein [Vibrio vulnificus]MCG9655792.1 hypothetical protein [Vibrio vulnificus]
MDSQRVAFLSCVDFSD